MTTPGGTWDWMVASVRSDGVSYTGTNGARAWYNETRHLWAFHRTDLSKWIVAKELVPHFEVSDGVVLKIIPNFFYDGEVAFSGASPDGSSPHVLFYCARLSDYIYKAGFDISEPVSYKDLDGETNLGDAWYRVGYLPGIGDSIEMTPQGTQTGGNITLACKYPRWERRRGDRIIGNSSYSSHYIYDHPIGVYEAKDQEADDIVIGIQAWSDADGTLYERSLKKDSSGNFRYGTIAYNQEVGAWTPIGADYPRGSQPNRDFPVVFFDKDGNIALTLTFAGVSPGLFTAKRFFAEACVWR